MDGVNELDPVDVTAELEDINIGIINSRKLSVRALVMLKAEMRMRKETELIKMCIRDRMSPVPGYPGPAFFVETVSTFPLLSEI